MKNQRLFQTLLFLSALLTIASLSACGSIKTREKDDVAVAKIKTAALAAYTADFPAAVDLLKPRGANQIPVSSPENDRLYEKLNQAFQARTKWKMLDTKKMRLQTPYRLAFEKTMKGFQNKMPINEGVNRFVVENVMDSECLRILDVSGRDKLMTDLGVDALVVAKIDVHLNGTTIMGVGSRYPQSVLSFFVFERGQEKPVWFEGSLKGKEMGESVGKTAFIDEPLTAKLAAESAETAFAKINGNVTD